MGTGEVDTVYLSLNDVVFNPQEWFLAALAYSWTGRDPDDVEMSDIFDEAVGSEVGDVDRPSFALSGMAQVQRLFADNLATASDEATSAAETFVFAAVLKLVEAALGLAGDIGLRVALSSGDTDRVAVWNHQPEAGRSRTFHVG
jgi:hypothetical protein